MQERYTAERTTNYALGLDFALLREAYLNAARTARPERPSGNPGSYVICFGGSDARNISGQLIRWLTGLGEHQSLDVVLGAAATNLHQVEAAAADYPGQVRIHRSLDDVAMIELYRAAAVAFLPASTTLIEALACGVPVVGGFYVDNQRDIYAGLVAAGAIHGVGDWNAPAGLGDAIQLSLMTKGQPRTMVQPDGYSDLNLRSLFGQLAVDEPLLVVRRARLADARQFFHWVNDPGVRQNSINQRVVAWEDHLAWFTHKISDGNTLLLHAGRSGRGCGQLRYDTSGEEAVITISVDAAFRGQSIGKQLLRAGEEQLTVRHPTVKLQVAFVRPENRGSRRLFEQCGFRSVGRQTVRQVELLRYEKPFGI